MYDPGESLTYKLVYTTFMIPHSPLSYQPPSPQDQPALLDSSLDPPDILLHVLPIQLSRLGVGGAVRVWIVQQTLDRREDRGDIIRRRPAVLEDVKAELAVCVNVWMEHARKEFDGGGLVGV